MRDGKQAFVMYKDWEDIFNCFQSDEDVASLIRAIFAYVRRGERPIFEGALKVAYTVIENSINRDLEKWQKVCEARSQAGKKGGRPRKEDAEKAKKPNAFSEKQTKAKKAKKADSDTDTDTVTVSVTESESVSDSVSLRRAKRARSRPRSKANKSGNSTKPIDFIDFGEYSYVKLTAKQHNKLIETFGEEKTADYIRRVDEYCQQTGKVYCDYYLTICKWIRIDEKAEREKEERRISAPVKGENSSLPPISEIQKLMEKNRLNNNS